LFTKHGFPKSRLSTTHGAEGEHRLPQIVNSSSELLWQPPKNKSKLKNASERYLFVFIRESYTGHANEIMTMVIPNPNAGTGRAT
jgi:hypothetical protein